MSPPPCHTVVPTNTTVGQAKRNKYTDRVPVHVRFHNHVLPCNKFLVPEEITVAQFTYYIRRITHIRSEDALFFFAETSTRPLSMTATMRGTWHTERSCDDVLHITVRTENAFG